MPSINSFHSFTCLLVLIMRITRLRVQVFFNIYFGPLLFKLLLADRYSMTGSCQQHIFDDRSVKTKSYKNEVRV